MMAAVAGRSLSRAASRRCCFSVSVTSCAWLNQARPCARVDSPRTPVGFSPCCSSRMDRGRRWVLRRIRRPSQRVWRRTSLSRRCRQGLCGFRAPSTRRTTATGAQDGFLARPRLRTRTQDSKTQVEKLDLTTKSSAFQGLQAGSKGATQCSTPPPAPSAGEAHGAQRAAAVPSDC